MGFVYQGRKLCCDCCGTAGARKMKCPHGYCPPVAMCPNCRKGEEGKKWRKAETHAACLISHNEMVARDNERAALIDAGKPVRCAALGVDNTDFVHVLFQTKNGSIGRFMKRETYEAFPLLVNVTLEQYEAKEGKALSFAPGDYYSDACKALYAELKREEEMRAATTN